MTYLDKVKAIKCSWPSEEGYFIAYIRWQDLLKKCAYIARDADREIDHLKENEMTEKETIKQFLAMCQQTCSPTQYEAALDTCSILCSRRGQLKEVSLKSILEEMKKDDMESL